MSAASHLVVDGVDVRYGGLMALCGVSLKAERGRIVSVIGANGAGKSTLLQVVAGLTMSTAGSVAVDGEPVDRMQPHERVARGIALVPEGRRLFARMSVRENLIMGAYLPHLRTGIAERLRTVYRVFPILESRAGQNAGTLSGGEQQMLAIGRALMSLPRLLLCDEISLGLAPVVIRDIYTRLEEINRAGTTVLLVEQDMRRSLSAAHHAYVMLKGRVVLEGPPARLSEEQVRRAYFGI